MRDIYHKLRKLDRRISSQASIPVKDEGSHHDDSALESIDHRIDMAIQRRIQLARTRANARLGSKHFNPKDFEVVYFSLVVHGLNSAFQDYRIVQISDIHLGQWLTPERLEGVVDLINEQHPDLIVITGDSVSYVLDGVAKDLARALGRLRPKDATVAVLGNHDHWMGPDEIRSIYRISNVLDLSNEVFTLKRGDGMLHIAGVDDVLVRKDRLEEVIRKLPSGPAILLVHEPDFAEVSAKTGRFFLQLSGHSHGGQLVLPGLGTPIRGFMFGKYPLGRYQVGNMIQYTNRGLGTNLFWSRINCPPEITVINLLSPKS